ncbi:RNA-binding domain-containing protein [Lactobacillus gasseri]|jgi:ATP-dependent DNA helicase RecG|uniref:RNA-binding domain-containing protein n=1 Tax=Lactobacillus gasseri TaxID=1596 RepID=UPI0022E7C5A7|nr:RNA-binding domain-containing protein [Lactobacillus gasseri]
MNFFDFTTITSNGTFSTPAENENIEYKEASWKLPKTFWETVSSFANTSGGIIILGISEDKSNHTFSITGVDTTEDLITQIFNDNNNPSCLSRPIIQNNDVKISKFQNKNIIQILIHPEPFNARPVTALGKAYIRTGDGDRIATQEQLKYFTVESQGEIDTHLLPSTYTLDDLNKESIRNYRQQIIEKGIINPSNQMDDKEFLYSIGVFRKDRLSNSNQYHLTDGGLLFFGNYISITDRFPRFQLDYQKYNSDNSINWIDRVSAGDMNYPNLNVYTFYRLVLSKLEASIPDPFIQGKDLSRTSYHQDLISAAKEALVNSLMHSYYDGAVGVKIVDRPSYFEFTNPGTMRVSKESFLRGQYSSIRNTEIASLFRRVGISETAASGGPRILNAALQNHLNDPEISIDYNINTTRIRIWKISSQTSTDINLSDIEKFILKFGKANPTFTVKDIVISPNNHFGKQTAVRNALNSLIKKGLISSQKRGRKFVYKLRNKNEYLTQVKHLKHLEDNILK